MDHFESRMYKTGFCWFVNTFLAFIIFYNAELGHWLGIEGQALAISLVWPAAGIALAALLIFGQRAWLGIFLGYLVYNFLNLSLFSGRIFSSAIAAIGISFGSLLQAFTGNYFMRRFSSPNYFFTVKDVFVFLIFGGLFTCLIAPSINLLILELFGMLPGPFFPLWLTFWIGDLMGVYIMTPLLIVWTLSKPRLPPRKYYWEIVVMILCYFIVTVLTFFWNYPLSNLLIPLCLWVAFRFRMQGATFAIFLTAFTTIIFTSMGMGEFNIVHILSPLFVLVIFLEIIVAASLILAAAVNERETAWNLLKVHNISLQQAVDMHLEEIKAKSNEIFITEKLASLGLLTSDIARHVNIPLDKITQFTKDAYDTLIGLRRAFSTQEKQLDPLVVEECQVSFEELESSLREVGRFGSQAKKIVKVIQEQSLLAAPGKIKVRVININMLLNLCLNHSTAEIVKRAPDFEFNIIEEFDTKVKLLLAFPENFANAFIHIFDHAIQTMLEKKKKLGDAYQPTLKLTTKEHPSSIEIVMWDDGMGLSEEELKATFQSFVNAKPPEEVINIVEQSMNLRLALAHDIIVRLYHGTIKAQSKVGEYLELKVLLPKQQAKGG